MIEKFQNLTKDIPIEFYWFELIFLFILAYIIEKITFLVVDVILIRFLNAIDDVYKKHLANLSTPISKIAFLVFIKHGIKWTNIPGSYKNFMNDGINIILSICIVWTIHRIINLLSYYFTRKASLTLNKFDDIFIPLITKTLFVVSYCFGAVLVAWSFKIDVTSILAGLGIGGLAFAFAAKDTLANFFGSIMLVLDRPFDIGDVITIGDIEGTVVEVGFRSTRIRTHYDSLITISNGQLMNMSIDNKGKRRYRRLNTTLGIEYDTPPEKVEAFCEGIRQIIVEHKWTRKDNFNVYFVNFGDSALEIQLMVYWETADYAREQAEKHRLMIDVLRLAIEMEIGFAFPTHTVHLFNEAAKPVHRPADKYFEEGIQKAKNVTSRPFSLKNPRSNNSDKSQFGDNDIGL